MNVNLKKVLYVDLLFSTLVAYTLFINLFVWNHNPSIFMMSFYYLMYFLFRYISYFYGASLLLKGKIHFVLFLSAFSMIVQITSIISILPKIENTWVWLTIAAIPIAFFASFFSVSFNQFLSHFGKEKDFENYFSIKTFLSTGIHIFVPIISSIFIYYFSFESVSMVMILFAILMILFVYQLPKINLSFEPNHSLLKDTFQTKLSPELARYILIIHGLFMFFSTFFQQYKDSFSSIITFIVGENEVNVALINVTGFILTSIALLLFKKLSVSNTAWYSFSILCIFGSMFLSIYGGTVSLLLAVFLFAFGGFYFSTLTRSISFKLIDNENDYHKLLVLLKREFILITGKIMFTFLVMFLSIETVTDQYYQILIYVLVGVGLSTIYFYSKLENYTKK